MNTISQTMAEDHTRCDNVFAEAEELISDGNWAEGRCRFQNFRNTLEHHFEMEEGVLFPAIDLRTGMSAGPTAVMRSEHAQMRGILMEMADAVEREDQEDYLGGSETMLIIMQQHNTKEEHILYPQADHVLSAEQEDILARMAKV